MDTLDEIIVPVGLWHVGTGRDGWDRPGLVLGGARVAPSVPGRLATQAMFVLGRRWDLRTAPQCTPRLTQRPVPHTWPKANSQLSSHRGRI